MKNVTTNFLTQSPYHTEPPRYFYPEYQQLGFTEFTTDSHEETRSTNSLQEYQHPAEFFCDYRSFFHEVDGRALGEDVTSYGWSEWAHDGCAEVTVKEEQSACGRSGMEGK